MSHKSVSVNQNLHLGIEAARAGQAGEARKHLIAVLKQDPDNVPAMLWLAFVLPSPHDSIRLLQRVLALDPGNERARAGLRWAKGRLGLNPDQPGTGESGLEHQSQPAAGEVAPRATANPVGEPGDDPSIRQQLLSGKIQKQARKGALAQRARRTINPLLGIILITGLLGILAIGMGALSFVPPDVLAAWLPVASQSTSSQLDVAPIEPAAAAAPAAEPAASALSKKFNSQSDTLEADIASAIEPWLTKPGPAAAMDAEAAPGTITAEPAAANLKPVSLSSLVGPALPSEAGEAVTPVNNLLLAHQPAYPGEKWIEVNVTTQQITAWEGDVPVFSFIGSTGLPGTPTVLGEFNIYWKLESTLMVGPGYYLPEVPYTMYFYGGYALHGTYWHNNFGQPMSHGCVNLETGNAQKLFEWADPVIPPGQTQVVATADNPGTLVVVHE